MPTALAEALAARGYDQLTPVQQEMTRPDITESDLLVSAQTGSGKTVGFGLALAPTLLSEADHLPRAGTPLALIIAPTRELALQVGREFEWLYQKAGAVLGSCVGGMDMRTERRTLERGTHIVVGTPGRLRDHIQRGSIDLSDIRAVVLDEADEMLDLGFAEDLEFILSEAPESRRTLMFSATVPRGIEKLSKNFMRNDAIRVQTAGASPQHTDIEYRAYSCRPDATEGAVINALRYYDAANAIVFCNTRAMVNRLTARLSNRGFQVVALSGELSQAERTHALQAMRDGRARVCVATDVAARGIDLPKLDLVVHAELPTGSETLLHRSGRTGRAGRKGVSALIVTNRATKKAERLLKWAKVSAEWTAPPSADDVRAKDRERMLADPVWTEPAPEALQDFITTLAETYTPEQLAKAYLALYETKHTAPEELDTSPIERKERTPFGPSAWLSLSIGHNEKAEPRWLLPMLCRSGGISKDDIGAIRIQDKQTFVELKEASRQKFLEEIGPDAALEQGIKVTSLSEAPKIEGRSGGGARAKRVWGDKPGGKAPYNKSDRDNDRGDRGDRGPRKPRYDDRSEGRSEGRSDAPYKRKPKPPRDPEVHADAKPHRKGKPPAARSEGDRPERSKAPRGASSDRPPYKGGKPSGGKPAGKPSGGKPAGKPGGKFGKPGSADPKKSFRDKPRGGKPGGKGPNAVPKRKK
ncbi:MAG: DEAD/DEAH box helicase [Thalassovita sp.]